MCNGGTQDGNRRWSCFVADPISGCGPPEQLTLPPKSLVIRMRFGVEWVNASPRLVNDKPLVMLGVNN